MARMAAASACGLAAARRPGRRRARLPRRRGPSIRRRPSSASSLAWRAAASAAAASAAAFLRGLRAFVCYRFRSGFAGARALLPLRLRASARAACSACRSARPGALARFGFFAQAALFGQLFFLAADQLGLAARFFLAAREFGVVDRRGAARRRQLRLGASTTAVSPPSSRLTKVRFLRTSTWMVRALPVESACLISLVDFFTSVIFLRSGAAVPWLACRKPSSFCLSASVSASVRRGLGHARAAAAGRAAFRGIS